MIADVQIADVLVQLQVRMVGEVDDFLLLP